MTFGGRWEIIGIIAAIITAIAVIPILLKNRKRRKTPDTISENNETPDDKWPEENYEFITGRIRQLDKKYKSILFASAQSEALPVTIPVNVAIDWQKAINGVCLLTLMLIAMQLLKFLTSTALKPACIPNRLRLILRTCGSGRRIT